VRHRLPEVLTQGQAEHLLAQPPVTEPLGLRDRVILEVFYATGIRRTELSRLDTGDLDRKAGLLRVRHGKGRKQRIVPVGRRALFWLDRYIHESRPLLLVPPPTDRLFLSATGKPLWPDTLTQLVKVYLLKAGIEKAGACHLLRHTMATLMLENGADIRYIQEMLGHARLDATQIYTHVSIERLKMIHQATHPGARLEGQGDAAFEPSEPEGHQHQEARENERGDGSAEASEGDG
jgi:integrase/recombinase XerD